MKRVFILATLGLLVILSGAGLAAAQEGRGLVITHSAGVVLDDYIYPRLYRLNPVTGVLEDAAPDNLALVLDAQPTADQEQTIHLRDDLLWSDGSPVNAYDVLYSAIVSEDVITGIALVDDRTVTVQYTAPSCVSPSRENLVIQPVQVDAEAFKTFAQAFSAANPGVRSIGVWSRNYYEADLPLAEGRESLYLPDGLRSMPAERPDEVRRLLNGDLAVLLVRSESGIPPEEAFLHGDTNLLLNPDPLRRADLMTHDEFQIYDAPGWSMDYLMFNFADTSIPRSAYSSGGDLFDQGHNEFFSDKRLRQAVQLGIDVNAIIQAIYRGEATPIAGTLSPNSWGYNPALQPVAYDPAAASRLLDEAGWVDTNGNGIRNCFRCTSAEIGTELSLHLTVQPGSSRESVAELIAIQFEQIGIGVSSITGSPADQQFDLYLGGFDENSPSTFDPDQAALFSRQTDVVGGMGNNSSYYNPALEDLLTQARSVPDCDVNARAALYQQAQSMIADDLPMFGLYVRHEMFVAHGIQGFDPQPGNPFWNVLNWRVAS
ncbi:MAG: hypothetical protein K8I60_18645 [Anaerolineae bacterium]|nr:hypothetical protein [Anaerolineae bacterium]